VALLKLKTLDPVSAKTGESVTITAATGAFNSNINKNVVTFNGVVANILSGTTTELIVIVPPLADNGYVKVETFSNSQSATSQDPFIVIYDDEAFSDNIITPDPYHKGYINNRVKTLYTDPSPDARYNRDFSYSNFVEIVDENSMVQNFLSIILTSPLERMWEPELGSSIPNMPFQLISNDASYLETEIFNEVDRLLTRHEKRVTLIRENSIVRVDLDNNRINVVFAIRVPTGEVKEIGVTLKQMRNESM